MFWRAALLTRLNVARARRRLRPLTRARARPRPARVAVTQEDALPAFSTLASALRMVFPEGAPACKQACASLLVALVRLGAPFAEAVRALVGGMAGAAASDADLAEVEAELQQAGL